LQLQDQPFFDSQLKLAPSNGQVKLLSESWSKQNKKAQKHTNLKSN